MLWRHLVAGGHQLNFGPSFSAFFIFFLALSWDVLVLLDEYDNIVSTS